MTSENEPARSVQIRMLTVSGRDLTESVFRQLIEEPLIAEDGSGLSGDPWGIVNVHPDGCAPERDGRGQLSPEDHWHVVWQREGVLRRSAVTRRYQRLFQSPLAEILCDFCVLEWLRILDAPMRISARPSPGPYLTAMNWYGHGIFRKADYGALRSQLAHLKGLDSFTYPCAGYPGLVCLVSMSGTAYAAVDVWQRYLPFQRLPGKVDEAAQRAYRPGDPVIIYSQKMAALRGKLAGKSFDEVKARYSAEVRQEAERQQRQQDRREEIARLPQLFLAP